MKTHHCRPLVSVSIPVHFSGCFCFLRSSFEACICPSVWRPSWFCFFSGTQDLGILRGPWKDRVGLRGLHHLHLQRHRPGQPQLRVHGGREPGHSQGKYNPVCFLWMEKWNDTICMTCRTGGLVWCSSNQKSVLLWQIRLFFRSFCWLEKHVLGINPHFPLTLHILWNPYTANDYFRKQIAGWMVHMLTPTRPWFSLINRHIWNESFLPVSPHLDLPLRPPRSCFCCYFRILFVSLFVYSLTLSLYLWFSSHSSTKKALWEIWLPLHPSCSHSFIHLSLEQMRLSDSFIMLYLHECKTDNLSRMPSNNKHIKRKETNYI